jgi:predicted enzyme related to lactoylglutathione lyase
MSEAKPLGSITWQDLTVPDADALSAFYAAVCGWERAEHPMGDYVDYEMKLPGDGPTVAGICHARGTNASVPAQWLLYVSVPDVAEAARRCVERGGSVLDGPRPMGGGTFAAIRDPAGACLALWQAPA